MDAKDLRIDAASSEHNDGSKYAQSGSVLQCHRNKSYHDIGSNSVAKVDVPTSRPCAVIGPDRVVPPPATSDAYLKKSAVEPWPCSELTYRRPPDYPHRLSSYQNPTRNISPRQTFQENMQRIMVPPTYSSAKVNEDSNFAHIPDKSSVLKNNKMPSEGKYCDVPYSVNPVSEPKLTRNHEVCVSSVNPTLGRTAHPGWPPGSVNLHSPRTYGASEMYQYPEYPSCAGPRPVTMPRPHRTVQEEPGFIYPDPYYQDGNIRYKPYPPPKERYPQARYEYIGNYSNPFHPSPFPPHKYELQKPIHTHPYATYTPLEYLENRMADPIMDGYQRPNQQINYNLAYRNQIIHPTYGPMLGNPQSKMHAYPPDGKLKSAPSNSNKMYVEYDNTRNKPFPVSDNFFVNEMARVHPVKSQVLMANHPSANMYPMPPHPYFKKDNKSYEYMTHFKNMDPSMNMNNPLLRHPSRFSPNSVAISPTDSNASNDTTQTHGTMQEDCGYVSQSSTASGRSLETNISRHPHEFYRRYDFRYTPVIRTSPLLNPELTGNSNVSSKKKKSNIDVRQFLQMWNEGDEDTDNNNAKEAVSKTPVRDNSLPKQHEVINNSQEQLYVLGLVNVPSEELSKYEHIQKVSKLPENIKGYNNIDILNQFEEAIESSKINCFKPPTPRDFPNLAKGSVGISSLDHMQRPLSPLDVESKISQSVIHKEVGCNFEIKPCSPKMLNVEMAAPIQNMLSERLIEKVANPHMMRSPLIGGMDESMDTYNVLKRKDNLLNMNDNENNSSCKMVKTQYSTENPIDCMKTNYSLQDLESNSGVCLASLPRLDNDIELSFPEVNQQFINANKSPMTQTNIIDLPAPEVNDTAKQIPKDNRVLLTDTDCNSQFSPLNETDKEIVKLSKYRKVKPLDKREDGSWLNNKTIRTDSVIIKNPDNLKTFEELSDKPPNYEATDEMQQTPINLTSYCNDTNEEDHECKSDYSKTENLESSFDDAIDFSLNKQDYSTLGSKCHLEEGSNERKLFEDKYENESKLLTEKNNKIEDTGNSVSDQNDLKFESESFIVIEETHKEDITSHNRRLKSLPLISPDYNDANEAILNSSMCTQTAKADLFLESALKVEEELDKSHKHIDSTLNNANIVALMSSNIEGDVNADRVECQANMNENDCEKSKKTGTECEENIPYETSENGVPTMTSFQSDITLTENDHKSPTSSHQQFSKEAVLIDDNIKNDTQTSSPVPITPNILESTSHKDVLHQENYKLEESNSAFNCIDNLTDTEIAAVNDTCKEFILNESGISKYEQMNDSLILESNDVMVMRKTRNTVNFSKECYSPWIQKLILHNEGYCNDIDKNLCVRENFKEETITISPACNKNNLLLVTKLDTSDLEAANLIHDLDHTDNYHEKLVDTSIENINLDNVLTDQRSQSIDADLNVDTKEIDAKKCETILPVVEEASDKTELTGKSAADESSYKNFENHNVAQTNCTDDELKLQNNTTYEDYVTLSDHNCDITISKVELQSAVENMINFDPEVHKEEMETNLKSDLTSLEKHDDLLEDLQSTRDIEHSVEKSNIGNIEKSKKETFTKRRLSLKRSLSDSALSAYNDDSTGDGESGSFWPHRRRKINKTNNCDLITENLCSILQSNRRNSVSAYNEENVSICILIDNNCIITEENDVEEQKICYAELSETCLEDLQNEINEDIAIENTEIVPVENPDFVSFSDSSVLDDQEKEIPESWVDDVACVETVVSDEIAEDITIGSSPSSLKYTDYSENDESGVFSTNVTNYTDNIIYNDKMFTDDSELIENLYRTSQINKEYQSKACNKFYDKESLERILSESNSQQGSPCSFDHGNSVMLSDTLNDIKSPNDKENFDLDSLSSLQYKSSSINDIGSESETEVAESHQLNFEKTQDDTLHSCESSIDNVFSYKDLEENSNCITASSPEVSSTTSEERNSSILLKITNYKGSRISQISDVIENNKTNRELTKEKVFINTHPSLVVKRPLITKAAQKYIPPLKESIRDLKVKLPLPPQSLMKLKQMKLSKDEPKHKHNVSISKTVKKAKPKFEDVLKSIDEIQFKMHKEKSKKVKKVVPKVVIKKTQNGSHYTSTSNKDVYNPDLTGRKWQPWVFLEKNNFIDKMAHKRKTRAIFSHRKNTYVLAEKFRKYKSANSAKFVITQPKLDESSSGHLKYTIRLKHSY